MNIYALRSLFSEQVTYVNWLSTIDLLESTIFFLWFQSQHNSLHILVVHHNMEWLYTNLEKGDPVTTPELHVHSRKISNLTNSKPYYNPYSNTYSLASMSYNRNLSKCYLSPSHLAKYRYTQSMILTWGALANSKVAVGSMTRWTWWEWSELHSYAFLDFSSLLSCAGASSLPCFKYIVGFSWRRLKCVLFQSSPFSK